ncbi:MAG: site-specific DNA-methyltransferase [Acidimicrobiia bacterium]|nr:site-specific DNA-methyltransferase [Acidimicrobiia bacterium]MYG73942.1 site-specific DNA-methyltransferase [Acidimicrobiia bacterium]MYH97299.1 site-specific DNA-methyltransferase [Acidimicrobiia bacterium]
MPQLKLDLEPLSPSHPFAAISTSTQDRLSNSGESSVASTSSAEAAFSPVWSPTFQVGQASLFYGDCLDWLADQPANSIHGVVTDPPYGLVEYQPEQQRKLRRGRGGVWRIPPAFDGHRRSPVPRFTTLTASDLEALDRFFAAWADALVPVLVPGAHVLVASNPLLSHRVALTVCRSGFERRGEVVRLVMTMRGGDRPKNAHKEFPDVTVMPRSKWEPWLLFRKPLDGRVQDNLRKWGTGGLRRISSDRPFADVIASAPTRPDERRLAPHPSLKPQAFLRQVVRAILPIGEGVVLDPFAGSGSTIAAAEHIGYKSVGVESDPEYLQMAQSAIPMLMDYEPSSDSRSR